MPTRPLPELQLVTSETEELNQIRSVQRTTWGVLNSEEKRTYPKIETTDDAQRLIDRQRRTAGAKEAFFLILYPRQLTGYPLQKQTDAYRRWFKDVPHGFDNPWAGGE